MDGQVLGGGVVVLVAAILWLVYLLPSWYARHQYNATERNAVRMSQALRILAETSERPEQVELDLQTREAHRQAKLARQAENESLKRKEAAARAEQDRLREEAELQHQSAQVLALAAAEHRKAEIVTERSLQKARLEAERARVAADAAAEQERLRAELIRAKNAPQVVARRQARARRIVRLFALAAVLLGGAATTLGAITSMVFVALGGVVVAGLGIMVIGRMARVARTSVRVIAEPVAVAEVPVRVAVLHDEQDYTWTPRSLPAPLSSVSGSRAAAALDEREAREALRRAALEEAARAKAASQAPVSIEKARPAAIAASSGDAEIEAHVRQLLASRAAG